MWKLVVACLLRFIIMRDIIKGVVKMEKEIEMAKKIADEAIKNAPIIHKTKQELKMEELESQVNVLTQMVYSLQTKSEDQQGQLNMKVDANKVIAAINLSVEGTISDKKINISNLKDAK